MANRANGRLNMHQTGSRKLSNQFFQFPKRKYETQHKMNRRFVAIWLRHLKTDWMIRQQPEKMKL